MMKFCSFLNFEKSSKNSTRLLKWKNHQNDASVKGHTIKTVVKAQKKIHFSLFCKFSQEFSHFCLIAARASVALVN